MMRQSSNPHYDIPLKTGHIIFHIHKAGIFYNNGTRFTDGPATTETDDAEAEAEAEADTALGFFLLGPCAAFAAACVDTLGDIELAAALLVNGTACESTADPNPNPQDDVNEGKESFFAFTLTRSSSSDPLEEERSSSSEPGEVEGYLGE